MALALGAFYLGVPTSILARWRLEYAAWSILAFLLVIWANDTASYFVGLAAGRHKLAPRISPGKSWEGAAAGLIAVLNGINIFGAAMGALVGGLVLVGSLGLDGAARVGAGLSAIIGYTLGMAIALTIVYLSEHTALPIVMSPGLAALLLALTLAMCAISALSAIGKVMRIDPAMVFNR